MKRNKILIKQKYSRQTISALADTVIHSCKHNYMDDYYNTIYVLNYLFKKLKIIMIQMIKEKNRLSKINNDPDCNNTTELYHKLSKIIENEYK